MLDTYLTTGNVALFISIALLFWRVIDAIIKYGKKRRTELEQLAFDMAKIKVEHEAYRKGSIISYYFMCLDALRASGRVRPYKGFIKFLEQKESAIDEKISRTRLEIEGMEQRGEKVLEKIDQKKKIKWEDLYEQEVTWSRLKIDLKILIKNSFIKKKHKVK